MDPGLLEITPFVGVGALRFGSPRAEVRTVLGSSPDVFRRAAWSPILTDNYRDLYVEYSETDELEFVEVASGQYQVVLGGTRLMPGLASEVVDNLRRLGMVLKPVDSGFSIDGAGVELYVPSSEDDAEVEAVFARGAGYGGLAISFFGTPGGSRITSWPVEPHIGIAGVRLGEARGAVRQRLGEGMSSSSNPERSTDHHWSEGLVVTYDRAERVAAVVAVSPAEPAVVGIEALGRTYADLLDAFRAAGHVVVEKPAELYLPDLGVSVWWARTVEHAVPAVAMAMSRPDAGLPAKPR